MSTTKQAHASLVHTYIELLTKEVDKALQINDPQEWHDKSDTPTDENADFVAITKDGQLFFTHRIAGHWVKQVEKWVQLPRR